MTRNHFGEATTTTKRKYRTADKNKKFRKSEPKKKSFGKSHQHHHRIEIYT